jgi:hypothetical protein
MAIPFSRPVARARRRLARLAQAISKTSATEPKHEQSASYASDHLLLEADDMHSEGKVESVFLANAVGDDVNICLRLLNGNAGFEGAS